jgi:diaminopimelate decarboxylase
MTRGTAMALLTRALARMVRDEGLSLDVCSEGELARQMKAMHGRQQRLAATAGGD